MEDQTDVGSEITPEQFEGEETPKAESSPVKEAKTEDKPEEKADKTPEAEIKEESPDEKSEPKDDAEEAVEPEKPFAKADERKAKLTNEIRSLNQEKNDLVSQRNALKAEVERANAEVYQPATENELVDQGMNATDAKVEALRQEIEVSRYNERVADAQLTLSSESERVLNDFPIFNADSNEYDKELAEEAGALLEANLITDPNTGQVIGSNISPYKLYKTLARASGASMAKGQMKGQQDTETMLANADTASSASPPKKAVDPLIALWQED